MKESLLNYSLTELEHKLTGLGLKKYRAKQIYTDLHKGKRIDDMTTLSKDTKSLITNNFIDQPLSIIKTLTSKDGTTKYLFKLKDGNIVEGVLMQYKFGNTLCVSTQVGCGMGCSFCASGLSGLVRNLDTCEMLAQVLQVNATLNQDSDKFERKISNIVLMGSGEPLSNYENVTKFIDLLCDHNGLMMSQRNISISTCGVVKNIKRLADDGYKVTLSISLHAPNDKVRKSIMKIANSYTIDELIEACKYYYNHTGRRIMFEYILIKDINSQPVHAKELIALLKGLNAHVNLIPLNEVEGIDLKTVSNNLTFNFMRTLQDNGIHTTVRRTLGEDIDGACGQLRRRYINEIENK